jgi:DNA processing protein
MERIDIIIAFLVAKYRITNTKINLILEQYKDINLALEDNFAKLSSDIEWQKQLKHIQNPEQALNSQKIELDKNNIQIVSRFSSHFPSRLLKLSSSPLILFYQGDLALCDQENLITVVGSRNFTRYSELVLKKILEPVVQNGLVVVSGLAAGIDTISHEIAILNNQKTIAVIGSGLDDEVFFPKQNQLLKDKILQTGGLVMSEYPIGFEATRFSFPQRNRILAALSPVTWVVEAGSKSGSLITAGDATKIGNKVITTSASILEDGFAGNVKLIESGSKAITRGEDILELYGLSLIQINIKKSNLPTDITQIKIFEALDNSGLSVEQIATKTNFPHNQIIQTLSIMELHGFAKNLGQNIWVKQN